MVAPAGAVQLSGDLKAPRQLAATALPQKAVDVSFQSSRGAEKHTETGEDGKALARPRLVGPGDVEGGRYVSDLVELKVSRLAS